MQRKELLNILPDACWVLYLFSVYSETFLLKMCSVKFVTVVMHIKVYSIDRKKIAYL